MKRLSVPTLLRAFVLPVLAALVVPAGCATGGGVGGGGTVPAAARAEAVARATGADAATSERWHRGELLFSSRCQRCHALPTPASIAPERWPIEVQEMARKSGLDGDQVAQVTEYLVAAARATGGSH